MNHKLLLSLVVGTANKAHSGIYTLLLCSLNPFPFCSKIKKDYLFCVEGKLIKSSQYNSWLHQPRALDLLIFKGKLLQKKKKKSLSPSQNSPHFLLPSVSPPTALLSVAHIHRASCSSRPSSHTHYVPVAENVAQVSDLSGLKSQLCPCLVQWHWARHLISQWLHFLFCKMGFILTSQRCYRIKWNDICKVLLSDGYYYSSLSA